MNVMSVSLAKELLQALGLEEDVEESAPVAAPPALRGRKPPAAADR